MLSELELSCMYKGEGIKMIDGDGRCAFHQHCASIKFELDVTGGSVNEHMINPKHAILYCINNHRDCARYQIAEWLVNKKGENHPGIQGVPQNLQPNGYAVAAEFKKNWL